MLFPRIQRRDIQGTKSQPHNCQPQNDILSCITKLRHIIGDFTITFACSCQQAAESWTAIDDIRERRWHRDDCEFMNGRDAGNEPIGKLAKCLQYPAKQTSLLVLKTVEYTLNK